MYQERGDEGLLTSTEPATTSRTGGEEAGVVAKLSTLDRFLAVWILLAMALGLGLGRLIPGLNDALAKVEIGGISLPIAVGLLVMMYPVLAKVRYDRLDAVTGDKKLMVSSLVINWLVVPAVMFALAWIFLADLPEYRTGLIISELAQQIAGSLMPQAQQTDGAADANPPAVRSAGAPGTGTRPATGSSVSDG